MTTSDLYNITQNALHSSITIHTLPNFLSAKPAEAGHRPEAPAGPQASPRRRHHRDDPSGRPARRGPPDLAAQEQGHLDRLGEEDGGDRGQEADGPPLQHGAGEDAGVHRLPGGRGGAGGEEAHQRAQERGGDQRGDDGDAGGACQA